MIAKNPKKKKRTNCVAVGITIFWYFYRFWGLKSFRDETKFKWIELLALRPNSVPKAVWTLSPRSTQIRRVSVYRFFFGLLSKQALWGLDSRVVCDAGLVLLDRLENEKWLGKISVWTLLWLKTRSCGCVGSVSSDKRHKLVHAQWKRIPRSNSRASPYRLFQGYFQTLPIKVRKRKGCRPKAVQFLINHSLKAKNSQILRTNSSPPASRVSL
jgi:hypothetical protein